MKTPPLPLALLLLLALAACKTDINEINKIMNRDNMPDMSGETMKMWYTDSARLKYHVTTPRYDKYDREDKKYEEFPRGLHVISYDTAGLEVGTLASKYARRVENQNLWEIRDSVVVTNAEGNKLETQLLFWDMDKDWIYAPQPVRLTAGAHIRVGHAGCESAPPRPVALGRGGDFRALLRLVFQLEAAGDLAEEGVV
ncbi:MAG: LPS export ABC transporter periplasmic protein LptC [Odoribacteraceae bacterium]|jgi:LPS export ABC transporter protein LptC|nr:LPS export ABC transporter periplasmic protein LptC [Odoribacteraceae bacterium]